ncbi:lipid asymmetry maintenance protein MlaB [Halomonas kalidii]|uniref:STAS domain-containing protein n=1 Tax=Halomonas kalidii TaxID=3043293 RepID=A0ABT6VQE3_9GAMM|nr:STAS domain-containing protein [Halomonas kalidii]MDI5936208.1 STAS domain-containing protein [Halomonas kalidii]
MSLLLDRAGVRLTAGAEGLAVSGVVGFDVAAALAATGSDWLATQPAGNRVDFDLGGVAGVSSAALSVLLEWTRRARAAGLEVRAVHLSAPLIRLTRLAGLDRLLPLDEVA